MLALMKAVSIAFAVLTVALSFTMDVWDGTAFALVPLLATIGGVILRSALERGDALIGMPLGGVLIGACWFLLEWLGLRVQVLEIDFAATWWTLPSLAVGLLVRAEDVY